MLLFIKHKKHRLPWHITVGTLPLPIQHKVAPNGFQSHRYATNTFCGHRIHGFMSGENDTSYFSHDILDVPPQHELELCQNCVRLFEKRTGQAFDFIQLQGIQV